MPSGWLALSAILVFCALGKTSGSARASVLRCSETQREPLRLHACIYIYIIYISIYLYSIHVRELLFPKCQSSSCVKTFKPLLTAEAATIIVRGQIQKCHGRHLEICGMMWNVFPGQSQLCFGFLLGNVYGRVADVAGTW